MTTPWYQRFGPVSFFMQIENSFDLAHTPFVHHGLMVSIQGTALSPCGIEAAPMACEHITPEVTGLTRRDSLLFCSHMSLLQVASIPGVLYVAPCMLKSCVTCMLSARRVCAVTRLSEAFPSASPALIPFRAGSQPFTALPAPWQSSVTLMRISARPRHFWLALLDRMAHPP